jgi:hypothetical protein
MAPADARNTTVPPVPLPHGRRRAACTAPAARSAQPVTAMGPASRDPRCWLDGEDTEPVPWAEPEPVTVTWYQHAAAYAAMKWPTLAAHSRASVAEALATVTPALTRASQHAHRQPSCARPCISRHFPPHCDLRRGDGPRADVGGASVTAAGPARRPGSAPGGAGCPDLAAGWQPCCREHNHPQTRSVPRRLGLRGRGRPTEFQPGRIDQMAQKASGSANRRYRLDPVRHVSVDGPRSRA